MSTIRILVVEDDFISREVLIDYLSGLGEIDIAVNGREAVSSVKAAMDNTRPYDLICMDISMPEVDGISALEAIREIEDRQGSGHGNKTKVIMTTALSEKDIVQAAVQAGCDAYLVKPITHDQLYAQIREVGFAVPV